MHRSSEQAAGPSSRRAGRFFRIGDAYALEMFVDVRRLCAARMVGGFYADAPALTTVPPPSTTPPS